MRAGFVGIALFCAVLALAATTTAVATSASPSPVAISPDSIGPPSSAPDEDRSVCPGGPTAVTQTTTDPADRESGTGPRILELYPNPTTYGNVGEFFVIHFPTETSLEGWSVTDGHTSASLPNRTVSGSVAFSMDPEETVSMTDHSVGALEGHLRLSVEGDELTLRDGNRTVDRVAYDRAPLGELWYRGGEASGVWWPRDATCYPVHTVEDTRASVFALPDSPETVLSELESAEDRILLAGYTFTSEEIGAELHAAADRGVDVEILLEAGPVGGTPERTATVLDDLEDVTIRVLGGRGARYTYHHPKYAVVDDRSLVTTENWNPSGVGGTSSRGWGVVVEDDEVADHLEGVFRVDFEGRDTTAWERHRANTTFVEDEPPGDPYAGTIDPETVPVDRVETLLAPDNAEERLLEHLAGAEESILVKQVRIGDREQPLLQETLEAARDGVEVRILLDATWYVEDENRELAHELERTAEEEGVPLEVRLVEPRGRFEKIHAKGVVIDEETAVVGSINWNNNSLRNNREVALVLHGEEVGEFYASVFEDDWDGGSWPLPAEMIGVVVLALALAGLGARAHISFDSEPDPNLDIGPSPDVGSGFESPAAHALESDRSGKTGGHSPTSRVDETETVSVTRTDLESVLPADVDPGSEAEVEPESELEDHTEDERGLDACDIDRKRTLLHRLDDRRDGRSRARERDGEGKE